MASHSDIQRQGKFLVEGARKFYPKGVSYGTFAPDHAGEQFPPLMQVAADFAAMRAYGFNTVRTYTVPSRAILDEAQRAGLRVMVGMPWSQHVAFLDDESTRRDIRQSVLGSVAQLRGHPAVLMVALGNEIPASVVRWHGQARTERFLSELYRDAKDVAPEMLFTYVNFPPTEFLELPFLDVCSFNVYLHDEAKLRRYLARLQHVAGNLPLLISEAGADSIREGLEGQAELTAMQVRAAFAEGACGAIAYAWTDEWWRGGQGVTDWSFGLVDRQRRPKPAAEAVARVFAEAPFPAAEQKTWPKVSVVVCAYNAADTLDDCLTSLGALDYPDYEVIVVNDGSKDATGAIARRHPHARLVTTPNNGLSVARNIGLAEATGEIVAYTDADVRADSHWLAYLVQPFLTSNVVAAGGPNVVPDDDPWMAQCVARAPGGPTHVLFDDRIAEHVPGCNMAMRRDALVAIGGFNPIYLRAGDDVDVCWRLQAAGGDIGFAPAALVWHHHRPSIKAFWRQQIGYGEGEVWLQPHHPQKFAGSQIQWRGHVYSPLPFVRSLFDTHVDAGPWGTAPFPSVYHVGASALAVAPHTPSWQIGGVALLVAGLVALTAGVGLGLSLAAAGFIALATTAAACVRHAMASDIRTMPPLPGRSAFVSRLMARGVIAWLHVVQPMARARGRLRGMLTAPGAGGAEPRSLRELVAEQLSGVAALAAASTETLSFWSEDWLARETLLSRTVDRLRSTRVATALELDGAWHRARDLSLLLGRWGRLDVQLLVEEHAQGRVLVRIARKLRLAPAAALALAGAVTATLAAVTINGWFVVGVLAATALLVAAASRAATALVLADRVLARVLLDAGATPFGAPTLKVVAQATTASGALLPMSLPRLEQPTTRHAS